MKTDMSAHAVTIRLKQTSELRRLCVALAGKRLRRARDDRAGKPAQAPR